MKLESPAALSTYSDIVSLFELSLIHPDYMSNIYIQISFSSGIFKDFFYIPAAIGSLCLI